MDKLIHLLFYTCKQATLLLEKKHGNSISFISKLKINVHLYFCDNCMRYQKQSYLVEQTLKTYHKKEFSTSDLKLSDDAKIRIQSALNKQLKKD
jgi:hypothetical protein